MRHPHLSYLLLGTVLVPLGILRAQGDYAFDKQSPGTLGKNLVLAYAGAPASKSMLFMLSLNGGPTPLSLLNPADPRKLEVGLDAVALWFSVGTGTGSGTFSLPVPANASMHGAQIHFQTLTAPGSTFIVDKISNKVVVQLGIAGAAAALPAQLVVARGLMATFLDRRLSSGAGDVVLAGGGSGSLLGAVGLDSSEIYDFQRMTVRAGPKLTTARALAVAVTLKDGRVLLAGGVDASGNVLKSAEIYDPATHMFAAVADMGVARAGHAGCLLANGRVLVVGGTTNLTDPVQALANAQDSSEVFDPTSGQWSGAGKIASRRLAPDVHALSTGKALLSGGFEIIVVLGIPLPVGSVNKCQLFDPASGAWGSAAAMKSTRAAHSLSSTVLADNRLLVVGGAQSGPDLTQAAAIKQAEIYDPSANTWTALPDMMTERTAASVTLMGSGRVIVAGGAQGTLSAPSSLDTVEELDPVAGTWRTLGKLGTSRAGHGAAVTPDGLLVLFGGQGGPGNTTLASLETIHP